MRNVLVGTLALFSFGCAHQTLARTTPAAVDRTESVSIVASQAPLEETPALALCASDLDCGSGKLCIAGSCTLITPGMAACSGARVRFFLDSSELSAADRTQLERSARCLKRDQALLVKIEGNADERGTEEYNLALGDRRANTVSSYLAALGVSKAQLSTVTYGKENPVCTEHDEACWMRNRRADLKLSALKLGSGSHQRAQ